MISLNYAIFTSKAYSYNMRSFIYNIRSLENFKSPLMAAQFNESILKSNCSSPKFDQKSQSAPSAGRMPVPVTSGRGGVVDAVSTGALGSLRKPATRPVPMKESATKSAMTRFVRFAELAPLAMATLGCCT